MSSTYIQWHPSFSFPSGVTMDAQAGMTAHSQHWGQLHRSGPCATQCMCYLSV